MQDKNNIYYKQVLAYAEELKSQKLARRGILENKAEPLYMVYLRRSTKGKKKQQRSIPDQRKACAAMIQRDKYKIVGYLTEKETAHKSNKRNVFHSILEDIRKGKYNGIIAWHPDRLARNMKDAGEIIDLLDKGIIADLKFPAYTFVNDPSGKMALGIQFVLAKQYSDSLAFSTARGMTGTAEEGKYLGKNKYGYSPNKQKHFRPNEYFDVARKGWEMIMERHSLSDVAEYFMKTGFKKEITAKTLSVVFKDPFYAGFYIYGSQVFDIAEIDPGFRPMVTPAEFLQVRKILSNKNTFSQTKIEEILFRKMVYCDYCGRAMSPGKSRSQRGQRYFYLRCTNQKCERKLNKKLRRAERAKVVLDFILESLKNGIKADKKLYNKALQAEKDVQQSKIADLKKEVKSIDMQISKNIEKRDAYSKTMGRSSNEGVLEDLTGEVEAITTRNLELKGSKKILVGELVELEANLGKNMVPYEDFVNFFENISQAIQTVKDRFLLDRLIRLVYVNFFLGDGKVVRATVTEPFRSYFKVGFSNGVAGET